MNALHALRKFTSPRWIQALAVLVCWNLFAPCVMADHSNAASPAGPAAHHVPAGQPTHDCPHCIGAEGKGCTQAETEASASGSCEVESTVSAEQREKELQQMVLHAALVDSSAFGQLRVLRDPPREKSLLKKLKRRRHLENCVQLK